MSGWLSGASLGSGGDFADAARAEPHEDDGHPEKRGDIGPEIEDVRVAEDAPRQRWRFGGCGVGSSGGLGFRS